MALREVRLDGDPILRKKSRIVEKVDDRTKMIAEDLLDTMEEYNGAGLAAVQVGILRRMAAIYVEGEAQVVINPEIIEKQGSITKLEGCLSVPGFCGEVERAEKVKLKYIDVEGKEKEVELVDFEARAILHEIDHMEGILYTDLVIGELYSEDDIKFEGEE
ncbi:MAG: peptide deformylase [Tissierellia bacterium]|nr:peptide deformylase [Tissierellia bacterium]